MGERLHDKVAIVVGAGSTPGETMGNGRATAILFAREGARVLLVDGDGDSAEETRRMIASEGGEARSCVADVTSSDACARMAEACIDAWGRIDILHNNVGIGGMGGPVELTEAAWRRVLDVNVTSMFLTCKHVLPTMERQRSGAIVNISSLAAIRAAPYPMLAYNTSKAAVNGLTRSIAMQYADRGIRADAIMPGLTEPATAMAAIPAGLGVPRAQLTRRRGSRAPASPGGQAWAVPA